MPYALRVFSLFALLYILLFSGCKPKIPEGVLECKSYSDCPDGWECCNEKFCYSSMEKCNAETNGADTSVSSEGGTSISSDESAAFGVGQTEVGPPVPTYVGSDQAVTTFFAPISGGGTTTSEHYGLSLVIGAPQPVGTASNQRYTLTIGF